MAGGRSGLSGVAPTWRMVALVAGAGVVATVALSTSGIEAVPPERTSEFGGHPAGWAGVPARLVDALSYFTIWSNVVVALAAGALARRGTRGEGTTAAGGPTRRGAREDAPGRAGGPAGRRHHPWLPVLLLDALLMITITALVYWVVLAPTTEVRGLEHVTNPWVHGLTPLLALGTWWLVGPRRLLRWGHVPRALVIPLVWVAWTLARGAATGTYPYGFLDVVDLGAARAGLNVLGVLALGLVLAAGFVGLDRARGRG